LSLVDLDIFSFGNLVLELILGTAIKSFKRNLRLPFTPFGHRFQSFISLSSCSIKDEALVICLGGLTSLRTLELKYNMALTTLPSAGVVRNHCLLVSQITGSLIATSLSSLYCKDCPRLELARGAESMSFNLAECLSICGCVLPADSFINGLPLLSLSIGHQTSLESLDLFRLPDLFFLEGLSSLQLKHLSLIDVPNLTAYCMSQLLSRNRSVLVALYCSTTCSLLKGLQSRLIFPLMTAKQGAVSFI
jgi:hypothetical protein